MPSMREPDVERLNELYRSVTVYNLSEEVFVDEYMKTYYRIPARSKRQVPAMVANHWFGDPSLKKHRDGRIWEKEKRRVRDRRGNPNSENPKDRFFENMIASGKLLCYEFGTHLPDFYDGRALEGVKFSDGGTPIADGEMDLLMGAQAVSGVVRAVGCPIDGEGPIAMVEAPHILDIDVARRTGDNPFCHEILRCGRASLFRRGRRRNRFRRQGPPDDKARIAGLAEEGWDDLPVGRPDAGIGRRTIGLHVLMEFRQPVIGHEEIGRAHV